MSQQEAQEGPASAPKSTQRRNPINNPVVRNVGNKTSLRRAVDAMCAHCMGCTADRIEPGFREEIRNCTAPTCPLWHFRPYQTKEKAPARTEALEIATSAKGGVRDYTSRGAQCDE